MKLKSRVIMLVPLFLALLVFAAMAGGTTEAAQGGAAASSLEKTLSIRWNGPLFGKPIKDGNPLQQMIEEKFNVEITNGKIFSGDTEAINLMIASQEMPDAGFMYVNVDNAWDQGAIRSIPADFIRQYAPNQAKLMDENPISWLLNKVPGKDDEYRTVIMWLGTLGENSFSQWGCYRLDWMENLGIQPKGTVNKITDRAYFTTEQYTFDEQMKIFEAFKNDPDGNGKDDTLVMTAAALRPDEGWDHFIGMFGLVANGFDGNTLENGVLKMNYQSNAWREFLRTANFMYENGYVDPEWVLLDRTKMREKLTSGKVGFYMMPDSYIGDLPNDAMHFNAGNPEAKLLLTPPAIGPTGKYGSFAGVHSWYYNFFIGDKVDDEKLARILMILDWLSFDEKGKVYSLYGMPDVHFNWAGEPWNSSIRTIPQDDKAENDMGFYKTVNYYDEFYLKYMVQDYRRPLVDWLFTNGGKYLNWHDRVDMFNETGYQDLKKQYLPDILAKVQEFYIEAIIGEIDIDSDAVWDDYLKTLTAMGSDRLLAALQKAPKVAALREGKIEY